MTENLCGLCKANGLKKQLTLFQLNLEEAILLCENRECLYPLGVSDKYTKLIVRRQAAEIATVKRKRKKKQQQREVEEPESGVGATKCLEKYLQWQNVDSLPPLATRSRTLQSARHKLGAGNFEPYIPRKKRLLSYSCPNSPRCTNPDVEKSVSLLSSPVLSQSFLTWQDIKEQTKVNADDLQSDSGYSSPPSVSSCSSLPVSQSSTETPVSDCVEDLPACHEDENQDKATCNSVVDSLGCDHTEWHLSPSIFSSHKSKLHLQGERRHDISHCDPSHSIDWANKLEELLPDSLLDNSRDSEGRGSAKKLKLAEIERLSDEQDQFIRDLLAT